MLADNLIEFFNVQANGKKPRVFSIGPYGEKINFYAQQTRALILAEIFAKFDDIKKADICVIGAGIAGLTFIQGLTSKVDCKKLFLFEKGGTFLNITKSCTAKFIHPNMNYWPNDNRKLVTTNFPTLNWQPNMASVVCEDISGGLCTENYEFRNYSSVEKIEIAGKGKIKLGSGKTWCA